MIVAEDLVFSSTVATPLGPEDFFLSFSNLGEVLGGKIWNDRGELAFIDPRFDNRALTWVMATEFPIDSILKFSIKISEDQQSFSGEVEVDGYVSLPITGRVEADG